MKERTLSRRGVLATTSSGIALTRPGDSVPPAAAAQGESQELLTTSTHWGTYLVEKSGPNVSGLHPFPDDPDPSPLGLSLIDSIDHPSRISKPMVRKGWLDNGPQGNVTGRGSEPFVSLEWEDAMPLIANELSRLKSTYGNDALYAGSYGWCSAGRFHHATSQLRRFLNLFGGHVRARNTYSTAAAEVIAPHVAAPFFDLCLYDSTTWQSIVDNTELMVTFGGISLKNSQVSAGGITRHTAGPAQQAMADAGIDVINISPLKEDIADVLNARWWAARPGSDTAIMLGLAHTLVTENLHDRGFLAKYCVGYEQFEPYLLGRADGIPKTADWAAELSGLRADDLRALARQMVNKRTLISASWSLQRADHGEQPYWMLITLASMLGQIGLPGGGFGFGFGASGVTGNPGSPVAPAALPRVPNQVSAYIPVARIADMLLNPGGTVRYNGETLSYPDIQMIYWMGGNPFHHHQDITRLRRAWRKPETVIVQDFCWSPIARHADIVLPATTTLERNDLGAARMDPYLIAMKKAAVAPGEARNDYEIFSDLADLLGFGDSFTEGRNEIDWVRWLYERTAERAERQGFETPDFEDFWAAGHHMFPRRLERTLMAAYRDDPNTNRLETPSGRIEIFSETIAAWNDSGQPGHAVWHPPVEWLGSDKTKRFPLHIISNQPKHRLHSQYDFGRISQAAKVNGREPITISSKDAYARGICDGDVVKVFNDRGACLAGAVVSDTIRPGVVRISTGAWYDPANPSVESSMCIHGNVNMVTRDAGTSTISQGPSAQSCLVEVEKWSGDLPKITAFHPPNVI